MPSDQTIIDYILKTKSIVDYLEKRGIQPIKRLSGGKLSYLCPMPNHSEAKPSFIVFTNSEYENFYCFGCHAGTTIINLVAGLDGISVRSAIEKLSDGAEISADMDAELAISRSIKRNQIISGDDICIPQLEELSTMGFITYLCKNYLDSVEDDPEEVAIIDRFWEKVDSWIYNYEFEELKNVHEILPTILTKRREKFQRLKGNEKLKELIKGA